jgi:hypothetical protein
MQLLNYVFLIYFIYFWSWLGFHHYVFLAIWGQIGHKIDLLTLTSIKIVEIAKFQTFFY